MTEFTLGYREVIPYESPTDHWNDITLTTGKKTPFSFLYKI